MPTAHLIRALLGAALLTAAAGHAADKPKEATFGGGKASGPFLTKAQLRDCMDQRTKVRQQQADLLTTQDKLKADKAEISRSGDELKADLEKLDRTNLEAVNAFNARSAERDKMIDAYQEQANQFNARVEQANTEREAYTKACENRRYFEDDEIAIRKGK